MTEHDPAKRRRLILATAIVGMAALPFLVANLGSGPLALSAAVRKVAFRPEELSPSFRRALSVGRIQRAELATYFKLETSRPLATAKVIDEANSSLCDGRYVDGNWVVTGPKCQDQVSYKSITKPTDYVTVKVSPVS